MCDVRVRRPRDVPAGVAGVFSGRPLKKRILSACVYAFLMLCAYSASAQQGPVFYNPQQKGRQPVRRATPASSARPKPIRASTIENGKSCNLITFEGLGDIEPIPAFDGITSPGWLSIIENYAGGSGNFSNEPSPVTTAFWLNPTSSQDIVFADPVSTLSFYYASLPGVALTAYDKNNVIVASAVGGPNYDYTNNTFDNFSFISVDAGGNKIARVTVSGNVNQTGIDDLKVCKVIGIDSVEVTQAIQQWQSLDDLKASLTASNEPPVPIVSGKPAVMRVYMNKVDVVAPVAVQISGVYSQLELATLTPNCATDDQRKQTGLCRSIDFYFTPPSGAWQANLQVLDSGGGVLQSETLSFTSRDTNTIRLRSLSVCDDQVAGVWKCGSQTALLPLLDYTTRIFPTKLITTEMTNIVVRKYVIDYDTGLEWWGAIAADIGANYSAFDLANDVLDGKRTTYVGMVRPGAPDNVGQASGIPSNGLGTVTSATELGLNSSSETFAHELGHTLGLKHTNTQVPIVPGAGPPPGCDLLAKSSSTDWPFADNYIQSAARQEVGFDVAAHKPVNPTGYLDIMGYCMPQWIAPIHYKTALTTLGGGAVTTASSLGKPAVPVQPAIAGPPSAALAAAAPGAPGPFFLVKGVIQPTGVQFDPLFQLTLTGSSATGTGTYTLIEQNAGGQALFTRHLTPLISQSETPGVYTINPPTFSEVLPVQAGVAAIVLKDTTSVEIGRITLGGNAPVVAITAPAAGFIGTTTQNVSWTVQGPVSFTAKVLFSPDTGVTWSSLGDVRDVTVLSVDFSQLPGTTHGLIQVLVSDGVNTGSATSAIFTIPKHTPSLVSILSPSNNFGQSAADTVHFNGVAYDVDDGMLSGTALHWNSDLQGALGTGSPLDLKLQPGNHQITLTATDSDGNSIASTINVIIGGQPPVVSLDVTELDHHPTTCVNAVINASPGANGAALARVQYSLNAGQTYTDIPLASLPYAINVPGSGFFHMIASATDLSGQISLQDASFFTQSVCLGGLPAVGNVSPGSGHQGQTLANVTISGQNTHFVQGSTVANFGAGITVNSLTVTSSIVAIANITIAGNAAVGTRTVSMTTAGDVVTGPGIFAVTSAYAVSVAPNAGASSPGKAQTFVFSYFDGAGSADLSTVSMLINSSTGLNNACNVEWNRSDNNIRVYNDGDRGDVHNSADLNAAFGNSQCSISYDHAIVQSGNNLTMTLSITFALGFIGTKNVYMEAIGTNGGDSGLQFMGNWAVRWVPIVASVGPPSGHQGQTLANVAINGENTHFAPGITVANFGAGITVNSVTVSSFTAATASITIAGNAALGARDITVATGGEVAPASGAFSVTAAFPASVTPINGAGGPGTAKSFVLSYTDLGGSADLAQVSLLFNSSTSQTNGCNVVWVASDNSIRLYTDAANGYFSAPAAAATTFGNSQCTVTYNNAVVAAGNNLTMTLSITFANSFMGVQNVYMEAQGTTGGESGLQLMGTWNVANLPAVASVTPASGYPGQTQANVAIAGQLTHWVQGTTTASFGTGITVNSVTVSSPTAAVASITIAGNAAVGPRDVTMTTGAEVAPGAGAFAVTDAYPVSFTPSNGGSAPGATQTFVFSYTDANGNADLTEVRILINSSPALTNGCYVAWARSDNTIRLYDDGDLGFTHAPANVNASFGNSQCTVSYSNAIAVSGNNLTMTLSITFAAAFPGSKNVYMEALSTNRGDGGLQPMGTWAITSSPIVGSVTPNSGYQGQTLAGVAIAGAATNFVQGTTVANFGPGITVNSLTVNGAQTATANITVASNATLGANTVTMTTGAQVATLAGGFTVTAGYPLTLHASPAAGGSITASPTSGNGYYGAGTSVQLTAAPASGYLFSAFSGDLTGSINPQNVTMSSARSVTANFTLASVVPNVVGMTQANATTAIVNAGLVVGNVTTTSSGTVPVGSVISQGLTAGSKVNPGSAVDLVISTGTVLLSIAVTPANSWTVVDWTPQFTATGTYAGNTTADITNLVTWASTNTGAATVAVHGLVTAHAVGSSTISATLGNVSGSTNLTVLALSKCDITANGATTVADVQQLLNEVMGLASAVHDLNGDGLVHIADVQIVIDAVMSPGCAAK